MEIKVGTKELVKSNTVGLEKAYEPHLDRLASVTGRKTELSITPTKFSSLKRKGFVWVVDGAMVMKFKYAASIQKQDYSHLYPVRGVGFSHEGLLYLGDIPEFALDNIESAQESEVKFFSIHSNQALPTELVFTDPVVIGWFDNPEIQVGLEDSEYTIKSCGKQKGVVIAIWGQDGEELKI